MSLAEQLSQVQQFAEVENKTAKDLIEKRSNEYAQQFRVKYQKKQEKLNMVQHEFDQVQDVFNKKVKNLEENLVQLKKR